MRTRRTWQAVLLVLAFVLLAAPAGAAERKEVLQLNVAGNTKHQGSTAPMETLQDWIEEFKPSVVTLQELCRNQYANLVERLNNDFDPQWKMHSKFEPVRSDISNCGSTGEFGIAVFTRADILTHNAWRIDADWRHAEGDETRKILCAKVNWGVDTQACSTHVTNRDSLCHPPDPEAEWRTCRYWQVDRIQEITDNFDAPVIVGGDFNANPLKAALDNMYVGWLDPGGGDGRFKEADQKYDGLGDSGADPDCRCGAATHDSLGKIDYVFFNQFHFDDMNAFSDAVSLSDHHRYRAFATPTW